MEGLLGIGELARASGLPVSALRFYDGAGVLVPAAVDARTGYRRYRPDQVRSARLVARLRRVGMPLDAVRALLAGCDPGPVLDAHLARLEGGLADARRELSAVRSLLDRTENPMELTLDARALGAAIDAVRYAVGRDPGHPALHGVLLEPDGTALHAVATDRYRLATAAAVLAVPADGTGGRVLLPVGLVDAARELLRRSGGTATVTVAGDAVEIAAGGQVLRGTAAPAGDYPDWRRFAPAPARHEVTLDVPAFRAAVQAGPSVPKVREDGVAYRTVVLVLGPDGGLTVGGAGDGVRVGVNRDFLLDALPGSGQLVLGLDGPIAPLAIRPPGGTDWSLLMPVNLHDAAAPA